MKLDTARRFANRIARKSLSSRSRRDTARAGLSVLILGWCAAAQAQSAPTAPPEAKASPPALDTVTVSGRRDAGLVAKDASIGVLGDRALIDTPFSVNVLTRDLLDKQQAAYLGDFLKNDPSAVVSNVPVGFATLRGFEITTDGVLYDGMFGAVGLTDGRGQLEGLDRVEVLKGPAVFLYGLGASTSLGGTLNYIPKQAPEAPLRSADLTYTSRALFGAHVDLGDRFGEGRQFGYRLNLAYKDGEQATKSYDWKHQVATLGMDWRVSPSLVLAANLEVFHNDLPQLQPFFVLTPGLAVPTPPDASRNIAQPWDNFETRANNAYLRADWTLARDWSLTAQVLRSEDYRPAVKNARFGFITSESGDVLLFGSQSSFGTVSRSAQASLHGKLVTGAIEHQLTVSATALRSTSVLSGDQGEGVTAAPIPTNLYAPVDGPEIATVGQIEGVSNRTRVSSLLVSDILKFTEQWSVLVGARHGSIKAQDFDFATGAAAVPNTLSKATPAAALLFKPTPSSLVYLNYVEGIQQGAEAPETTTNARQRKPIVTEQIELGAKLELPEVTLATALFNMRKPFEYTDTSNTFVQNGEQHHLGLEFTATGRVTPDLTVVAGTMILKPTVKQTGDPATEGNRPVGVPRLTANVWGEWRLAGLPGLHVNGGVFHSGPQYLDATNTQKVAGFTRVDLGLRFESRIANRRVDYLFGVENATDKNYWSSAQSGLLTLAEPRTFKATVRFNL